MIRLVAVSVDYPNQAINIQWELENYQGDPPYTFIIYRSYSRSNWEEIGEVVDTYFYSDSVTPEIYRIFRNNYYKVKITSANGPEEESEPMGLYPRLKSYHRFLYRKVWMEEDIRWKKLNGLSIKIYKRKQWGTLCSNCTDPITKAILVEKCPVCYGTGYEGGFWDPYETYAEVIEAQQAEEDQPEGIVERNIISIKLHPFPRLSLGDRVVFVDTNEQFEVLNWRIFKFHEVPLHQTANLAKLPDDATLLP